MDDWYVADGGRFLAYKKELNEVATNQLQPLRGSSRPALRNPPRVECGRGDNLRTLSKLWWYYVHLKTCDMGI